LRIVPLRHFEEYGKCQGIPRGQIVVDHAATPSHTMQQNLWCLHD
jgi:hypothetical protein